MKNIFSLLVVIIMLSSCSAYQDVLKEDDIAAKYAFADSLYKIGKYKKASRLWEQITPLYRGRPQAERVSFLDADTYYQLGDYYTSGYLFDRFVSSFPNSTKKEEAAFKSAKSYFERSPRYNLDQGDTYVATGKLQEFISSYPESEKIPEVNEMATVLRTKIERKAYEIAKGYNKIGASRGTFPNAIKAFDNFLQDYPGSKYREDALYWRFNSAYQLAVGSIEVRKKQRLEAAKEAYETLDKYFPQGKYSEEATKQIKEVNSLLEESSAI